MWGRAQLLVLLTALSAYGDDVQDQDQGLSQLRVGRAVDIFTRYGYLSISMKVVPRNDTSFVFREPTIDIFQGLDPNIVNSNKVPSNKRRIFNGEFHMEFCDNVQQLLQAYFREFAFERLDHPWKAFTASWSPDAIARNLGINASYVVKDNCFVLVRLARFRDSVKLKGVPNNVNLVDVVAAEIDDIKVGDVASVIRFIRKYGSHYIESYVTGNALYQVFVFRKSNYLKIKERLQNQGLTNLDKLELMYFFSPFFAEHMGPIKVTSGNKTVEQWAQAKLRVQYYLFAYPALLKVHRDTLLLSVLNEMLLDEAILQLKMKTLAPAFKDPKKREFFIEVLDNFLKLWESNL